MVVGQLLLAHAAQVPEQEAAVVAATAKDARLRWVPCQRCDGVNMAFERVDLLLEVTNVPNADGVVTRGRRNQIFGARVEGEGIDGIRVAVAGHHSGAIGLGSPYVEDLQGHVVRHGTDPVLHDGVVLNVVDDVAVMSELPDGLDRFGAGILGGFLKVPVGGGWVSVRLPWGTGAMPWASMNIPEKDCLILASGCEVAGFVGVPGQAETLFLVPDQLVLGVGGAAGVRAVLGAVVDEHLAVHRQRGNDVGVLGLVSGLVDLAGVVDLLDNLEGDDRRLPAALPAAVPAQLAAVLVKLASIGLDRLGNVQLGNLEVVWLLPRCVSSDQQSVDCLVLLLDVFDVGEPLGCQGRPLERGAGRGG